MNLKHLSLPVVLASVLAVSAGCTLQTRHARVVQAAPPPSADAAPTVAISSQAPVTSPVAPPPAAPKLESLPGTPAPSSAPAVAKAPQVVSAPAPISRTSVHTS